MNTFIKVGAAGVLALSYASAHAGIIGSKSSSTPGDLLLFADVVSSTGTVLGYYVGDTSVSVGGATPTSNLSSGSLISSSTDTKLSALLALDTGTNTLEWGVLGGGGDSSLTQSILTTVSNSAALTALQARNNTNVGIMVTSLSNLIGNTLNSEVNGANGLNGKSYEGTTTTKWDPTLPVSQNGTNAEVWFNNGAPTAVTGYGQVALYSAIAPNGSGYSVAGAGYVTLSASGLSYSTSAVPLPPAVWLLGSGLLGLAGISRRKSAKA